MFTASVFETNQIKRARQFHSMYKCQSFHFLNFVVDWMFCVRMADKIKSNTFVLCQDAMPRAIEMVII